MRYDPPQAWSLQLDEEGRLPNPMTAVEEKFVENLVDNLKVLLAEAGENVLVAGSWLFLIIAFFAALAEPMAALLPLVIGVGCYLLARKQEMDEQS